MNLKIIYRNGLFGSILSVAPMFLIPIIARQIVKKYENHFIYLFMMVAAVGLVVIAWVYVIGLIIPSFPGYSKTNSYLPELRKIRNDEIMIVRIITIGIIVLALTIFIDTGFYLKLMFPKETIK